MSSSYIENYGGTGKYYFDYDPLYFEITSINVKNYDWYVPISYDDNNVPIPSETIDRNIGGTLNSAVLTVSSDRAGKNNIITATFRDTLISKFLSGVEQTVYHSLQNKTYTGYMQMPKFTPVNLPGFLYYTYTFELKISRI